MRVTLCVDALEPQLGGIGRYTWELCKGLARRADIEELRFHTRNSLIEDPALLLSADYEHPRRPRWPRNVLQRRRLKKALRSDVVHGPNYFLPAGAESGVVTIHDLSVFLYPETHPAPRVRAFERLFTHSLERASHVITDTETVRAELIEMFSVPPERVTAVHLGVDKAFHPLDREALEGDLRSLGLMPGSYGLCVSTLEPRKKISELLSAWQNLPRRTRDRFPLVLAGGSGWNNEGLLADIERGTSEGWLRHLGFVEEQKLPLLYAGAALFLYPSIYEGFGLPPVEALASGVPVIASGRSCLPEVGGDAPRYVDPDDIAGFAMAIEAALHDEPWRSAAIARGLDRARRFSWERCVDDTAMVYLKVIRGN